MKSPRIISLIASATEIVCALGMEKYLVGRSHECDFPPSVKALPQCTGPKFDVSGDSEDIDRKVKQTLAKALSVYYVDANKLEALQPTHIVTQTQCEVCAVSLKDLEAAACATISSQPQIISLEPNCLADIFDDIERVGKALDIKERADNLNAELKTRINDIHIKAKAAADKPRVACIEWIKPLLAAGNWQPELVELAGGINLFGESGKHSPKMTFAQVIDHNPDIIIVMPCGFDIERAMQDMPLLTEQPGWRDLNAYKQKKVFVADGNQFFNRPGPRVVEALEIMAELLHPNLFNFGHKEARHWISAALDG